MLFSQMSRLRMELEIWAEQQNLKIFLTSAEIKSDFNANAININKRVLKFILHAKLLSKSLKLFLKNVLKTIKYRKSSSSKFHHGFIDPPPLIVYFNSWKSFKFQL